MYQLTYLRLWGTILNLVYTSIPLSYFTTEEFTLFEISSMNLNVKLFVINGAKESLMSIHHFDS